MKHLDEPLNTTNAETRPIPVETPPQPDNAQSLLPKQQCDELRSRWDTIQTSFIDEPRRAVKDADALVLAAAKQLTDAFTDRRNQLEKQWSRGDEVSTEDLRLALQQYRGFFSRMMSL